MLLAEFLADRGDWTPVMPGARACLFSLDKWSFPLPLQLERLHFEILFCMRGAVTLTRQDGSLLTAGAQQVLILTDLTDLAGASVDTPLEGVLVAVDARGARESLEGICHLLGGLTLDTGRVRRWMSSRGGFTVEGPTPWSRAAFADLVRLPQTERARWCVWKSVEMLYLLSAQEEPETEAPPGLDAGSKHGPDAGADPPVHGRTPGRSSHHPRFEPPGLSFRHHVQGGVPSTVWSACSRLAAQAADGACGGTAAYARVQSGRCGKSGGVQQRQSICRRFPAAI